MLFAWLVPCLVVATVSAQHPALRVMFVGNSFTFVHDLPGHLEDVAKSMGNTVVTASSTIGGCTLYQQQPLLDNNTLNLIQQDWDYIVLQDYSILPAVEQARSVYLEPAVKAFAAYKKRAKIVMYMTWGYHEGQEAPCPSSDVPSCFPFGSLPNLTNPPCTTSPAWQATVGSFECMSYSITRGYYEQLKNGADMIAPCGVSWQVVRNASSIPDDCKEAIDSQYSSPLPFDLPLPGTPDALPDLNLYLTLLGFIDQHPNAAGQYLNALTFYAALFGRSTIGAAIAEDTRLTPFEGEQLQRIVDNVVLGHKDLWHIE